ncbi:hypothetical protein HanXRQr2_Chr06g0257651 [Helianthus annuus]|uniref:Uncharacterized protein n=1 Tax=Helianthus annuus TaxID=4232 RepID=A0A9K3IT51_HELAN|nr:hypothetical protein HanXRQr2_Chr06g0257651 [Helianthus annuus]
MYIKSMVQISSRSSLLGFCSRLNLILCMLLLNETNFVYMQIIHIHFFNFVFNY